MAGPIPGLPDDQQPTQPTDPTTQPTAAPIPGIPGVDPVITQAVGANTQDMPPGLVTSFPNAALWTALNPSGQSAVINKAYAYLSQYYGQDVATQVALYSLPPAQRALALQQLVAAHNAQPEDLAAGRAPYNPGDLTRAEWGDQMAQTLGAQPDDSILQHFQRLLGTALVNPEQVLGVSMTKNLNDIADNFNATARGEVAGMQIPVVSAIVGHLENKNAGITLNADWVRAHPGQAMAIQEYMAEKTNGAFKVDIQNSGIAAAMKARSFGALGDIIEPANIAASLVGMVGNQITQAISHTAGRAVAHAFGYTDTEINTAAAQTGTMQVVSPNDFVKQTLATDIPMSGMAGPIVGGFGMRADDPRLRYVQMAAGALAGFTPLDPINALGEYASGLRLAGKLPIGEATINDAEALSKIAESQTKNWLARQAFISHVQSVEDVTSSARFTTMNETLSAAIAAVPEDEQIGEMVLRLKALKLPGNIDLARALVGVAGDPEKMAQVWHSWFTTVERAPAEIRTALMSYKTANDSLDRMQTLLDGDTMAPPQSGTWELDQLEPYMDPNMERLRTGLLNPEDPESATRIGLKGRDEYDALKAEIEANGITEPIKMVHNTETGKTLIEDGYHRLAIAKDLGITEIPVEVENITGADNVAAVDWAGGGGEELAKLFENRDQLMAQRTAAENILREGERPLLMRYPNFSDVRSMARDLRPRGLLGKMFDYITHFPQSAGLESLSAGLDRWGTHFPSGEFHDPTLATGVERAKTVDNLTDLGKYLRVPKSIVRRAVQAYADLKDTEGFLDWSIQWRSDFAEGSKIMDPLTRDSFKQVYADVGRGPGDMMRGVISKANDTGHVTFEPVAYEEIPSTDGLGMTRKPVAVEPSEWTRTNHMPNAQQLRDQISLYRKFARRVPFGKDMLAQMQALHLSMDQAWAAIMIAPRNLFKTLFARVFTENTFSLMAAGRANALTRDGWLDLVKDTTIDPAAIIGDPNEALGTLKTTIEGDAMTVMSKGKAIVSPGDAFYGRSVSSRIQQLYEGSPRLTIQLLDKDPEEVLAWLKGETPEIQMKPITEVLKGSESHALNGELNMNDDLFWSLGNEGMSKEDLVNSMTTNGFDRTKPIIMNKDGDVIEGYHRLESARLAGINDVPVKVVDMDNLVETPGKTGIASIEAQPGVISKLKGGGPGTLDYDHLYLPWSRQVARTPFSELEMLQRMKQERELLVAGEPAMREAMRTGTYINAAEYQKSYDDFMQTVAEMEGEDRDLFTHEEWMAKAREHALEQNSEKVGGAAFARRLQTRGEEAAQAAREPAPYRPKQADETVADDFQSRMGGHGVLEQNDTEFSDMMEESRRESEFQYTPRQLEIQKEILAGRGTPEMDQEWKDIVNAKKAGVPTPTPAEAPVENGQWKPPSNVAGRYPLQSGSGKADMFAWFDKHLAGKFGFEDRLIKPEMKYLRIPTFKEFYQDELARLETVGVTGDRASQLAGEQAAKQTRLMFRDFTTATAADRWMRQFSWFFPAWKNIAERWLKVIPEARGGAVIGQLSTIRFAQNVRQLAEGLGIIRQDPDGQWYATIPGVSDLLQHFTGYQLKINPASLSLFGTLPSLNASITVPLTIMNQIPALHSVVDHIASLALPFGDVSIAPSFADSLWWAATSAAGGRATTPPWELVSRSSQQTRLDLSMADSMRMARTEIGAPPKAENYKQGDADPRYRKDYTDWVNSIVTRGRLLFAGVSFIHGLSMLASPASITVTPKWIDQTSQLYKELSIFPTGDPVASAIMDQFNRQYPNANWFLTGKTVTNGSNVPTPNGFNEYLQQLNDHVRRVLTPEEYVPWAAGIEELNQLNLRQQQVVDKLGGNLEGVLMNYHAYRGGVQDMHEEFTRYLMWNKDFAKLWAAHRDDVPAGAGESYFQTQELLNVRNDMSNIADLFTDGGIVDGDYNTMKAKISDQLNSLNYNVPGQPSSKIARDLKWYWDTVATPYYDQLSVLYNKLDSTPTALRQPIYDQIRQLNDGTGSTSYNGMTIPSPEEVSFNGLSNDAQKEKVAHWAINKVTYLDDFQLAQAYPDAPKGLGALTTFMSKGETLLAQSGLSSGSSAYDAAKQSIVTQELAKAKELGVDSSWVSMQDQPAFIRLQASGFGKNNDTLSSVINATINDWNLLSAHGESPRGSTADAVAVQQQIAQMIADGRAKDPVFDRLMSRLEIASAPAGTAKLVGVDMVMRVFFDTITPAPYAVAVGG